MRVAEPSNSVLRLKKCVQEEAFHYVCQPIYSARADRYTAAELLIRLDDPWMEPDSFIPLAEEGGFVGDLDLMVLRHAFRLLEQMKIPTDFEYLSVNLSPLTLEDSKWSEALLRLLREHRRLCRFLCVELTETALETTPKVVADRMKQIAALGIKLSIDDFGSGQSTFCRLMDISFDLVKLDKSLIDRLGHSRAELILSKLVAGFLRIDLDVVAEGLETESQYRKLLDCGCKRFQGYYFSAPIPEEEWLLQ